MNPALRDLILGPSAPAAPAFVPTSISGLQLWLDSSDVSSITLDGSNNVSQWDDKSGNGLQALQATALNRPNYLIAELNGLNAVQGNGSSHFMEVASFPSLAAGYTAYVVVESAALADKSVFTINGGTNDSAALVASGTGATNFIVSQWGFSVGQTNPTAGTNFAALFKYDGSHPTGNFRARLSTQASDTTGTMAQVAATPPTGTMQILRLTAGTGGYWGRHLYEILIWNRETTAPEDVQIKAYITSKWGLVWS